MCELYRLVETDEERRSPGSQMLFVRRDEQAERWMRIGKAAEDAVAIFTRVASLREHIEILIQNDMYVAGLILEAIADALEAENE